MSIRVKIASQDSLRIKSAIGSTAISQLDDIDVTDLQDGSVLVYSEDVGKWKSTRQLEKQTIECGQY
jgi:GrpB-like predicted nucleotidyltransferase (UPF0157 family)